MLESILKQLEETREQMVQSARENGVSNKETLRLSVKLDQLLNEYDYIEKYNKRKEA